MLVLSRFVDEAIVIGDHVVVTVVEICGGKVRLGVSAPADVRVDRTEVRARIEAEAMARAGRARAKGGR